MSSQKRFPGTRPFPESFSKLFKGRDRDLIDLTKYIETGKTTVLFGKSGYGKSSLLNAGIIPLFRDEKGYKTISIRFNSYVPGKKDKPIDIFRTEIQEFAKKQPGSEKTFLDDILPGSVLVWKLIKSIQWAGRKQIFLDEEEQISSWFIPPVLLVFDQFEELFTYPDGVKTFIREISTLLNGEMPKRFRLSLQNQLKVNPKGLSLEERRFLDSPLDVKVLFAIRTSRLGLLNRLTEEQPNVLRNNYELKPLDREQAEDAILLPAAQEGAFHSPPFKPSKELLNHLLDHLSQGEEKGIESFQLQLLCQHIENEIVLPKAKSAKSFSHELMVVKKSEMKDLETISEQYYDRQINSLPVSQQQRARKAVEEGMINEAEERRIPLPKDQFISRYKLDEKALNTLVDTHLIRQEESSSGGLLYELSHDALVSPVLQAKKKRVLREKIRLGIGSFVAFAVVAALTITALLNYNARIKTERKAVDFLREAAALEDILPKEALWLAHQAVKLDSANLDARITRGRFFSNHAFYEQIYSHSGWVNSVAFSPDGEYLLTGSDDGTAKLWEVGSGKEVRSFLGHSSGVYSVAFSPDGQYLLTGSNDQSFLLYQQLVGELDPAFFQKDRHLWAYTYYRKMLPFINMEKEERRFLAHQLSRKLNSVSDDRSRDSLLHLVQQAYALNIKEVGSTQDSIESAQMIEALIGNFISMGRLDSIPAWTDALLELKRDSSLAISATLLAEFILKEEELPNEQLVLNQQNPLRILAKLGNLWQPLEDQLKKRLSSSYENFQENVFQTFFKNSSRDSLKVYATYYQNRTGGGEIIHFQDTTYETLLPKKEHIQRIKQLGYAKKLWEKALEMKAEKEDSLQYFQTIQALGREYLYEEQLDSSTHYFQKAIQWDMPEDTSTVGSLLITYLLREDTQAVSAFIDEIDLELEKEVGIQTFQQFVFWQKQNLEVWEDNRMQAVLMKLINQLSPFARGELASYILSHSKEFGRYGERILAPKELVERYTYAYSAYEGLGLDELSAENRKDVVRITDTLSRCVITVFSEEDRVDYSPAITTANKGLVYALDAQDSTALATPLILAYTLNNQYAELEAEILKWKERGLVDTEGVLAFIEKLEQQFITHPDFPDLKFMMYQ